jgi:hypothetical protein
MPCRSGKEAPSLFLPTPGFDISHRSSVLAITQRITQPYAQSPCVHDLLISTTTTISTINTTTTAATCKRRGHDTRHTLPTHHYRLLQL